MIYRLFDWCCELQGWCQFPGVLLTITIWVCEQRQAGSPSGAFYIYKIFSVSYLSINPPIVAEHADLSLAVYDNWSNVGAG